MKKIVILIIITLVFSCTKNKEVSNVNDKIFNSKFYQNLEKNKKIKFLDSIYSLIDLIENDSVKTTQLFDLSAEYYYLEENVKSFKISKKVYRIAKQNRDSLSIGRSFYYMGDCFENTKKDSAYYYYKEAEKIFRLSKNKERLAKVHFNKAHLLYYEGNFIESEIEVIKALESLKINDKSIKLLYQCYSLQGSNHFELDELDNAMQYFELAGEVLEKLQAQKSDLDEAYDYNVTNIVDLSNVYDKKGEYEKSIAALTKIKTNTLKKNYPDLYASITGNLAYSLMKNGNFKAAKPYYEEAIALTQHNKVDKGYLYKIINYGEYHLLTKDTVTAKRYFNEALPIAKKIKNGKEVLKTLQFLSEVDVKKASFYKTEYIHTSDSVVRQQRANREKFVRIEYETEKMEDENKLLTQNNLALLITGFIVIIGFLITLFERHKRAQKRELALIDAKRQADDELLTLLNKQQLLLVTTREQEQKRISLELHDGVMNQIYGVRLNLDMLNELDDEVTKEKRAFFIKRLQNIEKEVRDISHDLHNQSDEETPADFNFLLQALVQSNNQLSKTAFSIQIVKKINWDTYSSIVKINLYRILQELFLNVHKYANATECKVTIKRKANSLQLKVSDNGDGFDLDNHSDGIGLNNIKERLTTIKGKLEINSSLNNGAKFVISIDDR